MSETAEKETWRCRKEVDVRATGRCGQARCAEGAWAVSLGSVCAVSLAVSRMCLGSV